MGAWSAFTKMSNCRDYLLCPGSLIPSHVSQTLREDRASNPLIEAVAAGIDPKAIPPTLPTPNIHHLAQRAFKNHFVYQFDVIQGESWLTTVL